MIVDSRVFHASIDLKKKWLPILLVLHNGFNNNPVPDVRVWMEVSVPLVKFIYIHIVHNIIRVIYIYMYIINIYIYI